MSIKPLTPAAVAHLAIMLARAERRRARLEEVAEVGVALYKEIAVRYIDGPYHPEPRNEPGRAYATVSRSVRLTFVLEARIDHQILAICNVDIAAVEALMAPPSSTSARVSPPPDDRGADQPGLDDADERVLAPSDREHGEHLVDVEYPDVPRRMSLRPAAQGIDADLGLDIDRIAKTVAPVDPDHEAAPAQAPIRPSFYQRAGSGLERDHPDPAPPEALHPP